MLKSMAASMALLLLPAAAIAAHAESHPTAREVLDAFERGDELAQAQIRMMDKAFPKETLAQGERFAAAMRRGAPDAELRKLAEDVGYQISYGPRRFARTAPDADLVALATAEAQSMEALHDHAPTLCVHPETLTTSDVPFYASLPMTSALVSTMVAGRDHPVQRSEATAEDHALLAQAIERQDLSPDVRQALANLAVASPEAGCAALAAQFRALAGLPPAAAGRLMVTSLIQNQGA